MGVDFAVKLAGRFVAVSGVVVILLTLSLMTSASAEVIPESDWGGPCFGSECDGKFFYNLDCFTEVIEEETARIGEDKIPWKIFYSEKCDAAYLSVDHRYEEPGSWYLLGRDCIPGLDPTGKFRFCLPEESDRYDSKYSPGYAITSFLGGHKFYQACFSSDDETTICSGFVKAELPEPTPAPVFAEADGCEEFSDRYKEMDTQNPPTVRNCPMITLDHGSYRRTILLDRDATHQVAYGDSPFDPTMFLDDGIERTGALMDFFNGIKNLQSQELASHADLAYSAGGCILARYNKSLLTDQYFVPYGTLNCLGDLQPVPGRIA